jgi:ATP-binding cassette subfamily B protein
MFDHLQGLPIGFFQTVRGGSLLSSFSSDLATVENAASMAIPWGLLPGLECIFRSVLLLAMDWRLGLATMTLWPWTILAPRFSASRARAAGTSRNASEGRLLAELQENLAVQPVVKAFGLEQLRIASFAKYNRTWSESTTRAGMANALLERSTTSGILLIQVVVLALGAWMAFHHQITIGTLVSFQALLLLLSNNLLYIMQYMPSVVQAREAMARVEDLLAVERRVAETRVRRKRRGTLAALNSGK